MRKGIGIDLGGTSLRVCFSDYGIVLKEPSLAAVDRNSDRIIKFGSAAEAFLKDRPANVAMTRPFRGGVVSRCETAQKVFAWCRKHCVPPEETEYCTLISVPCLLTPIEQSAMIEVAVHAGLQSPYVVYAPLAALYGAGYTVNHSVLMVNVGSSRSDILAVHRGECVYIDSSDAAGDMFDDAIVSYVQKNHHVRLSARTAEIVKNRIGTVWMGNSSKCLELGGQDPYGNRKTVRISSEEMFTILEEPVAVLMESICKAISSLPLDSVKDIFDNGILLSGGACKLDGLDKMVSGITGVRCRKVEEPADAVVRGLERLLEIAPSSIRSGCLNFAELLFKKR